jgi:hypothetical protein
LAERAKLPFSTIIVGAGVGVAGFGVTAAAVAVADAVGFSDELGEALSAELVGELVSVAVAEAPAATRLADAVELEGGASRKTPARAPTTAVRSRAAAATATRRRWSRLARGEGLLGSIAIDPPRFNGDGGPDSHAWGRPSVLL